jgi:hypothetical protein
VIDELQRGGVGGVIKDSKATLETMPQGMFSSDEELKAYAEEMQFKQDMDAIIMTMQATYLSVVRDFITE